MQIMSSLAQALFPCPPLEEFARLDRPSDLMTGLMTEDHYHSAKPERAPWNPAWFSFVLLV
jgi:hypothetical protein